MHVPTYIVILVAPINMLLNWLLGPSFDEILFRTDFNITKFSMGT